MRRQDSDRALPLWLYPAVLFGMEIAWFLVFGRKQMDQVKERLRPGAGARDGLSKLFLFYLPPWVAHYAVAWLDKRRLHLTDKVPRKLQIAGLIGLAISEGLLLWARTVNPFFSSVVRIQKERGHYVVQSGPYGYIRHPGYLSGILMPLCSGLTLGSWMSVLVGVASIPFLIQRTLLEEKVLIDELEGYAAYARKVRYRLLPYIW